MFFLTCITSYNMRISGALVQSADFTQVFHFFVV